MKPKNKAPAAPRPDLADLRARDVMQHDLVCVRASDPLTEVERVLADARVSGVPVLDDDGQMLGVLSAKDLVRSHAEDAEVPEDLGFQDTVLDPDDTEPVAYRRSQGGVMCAGDVMTTDVASVGPDTSLVEVARTMVQREIHRLLVVDRGRLVGIVSTLDVLRPLAGLPAGPRS
ncbi:MAG: CBS domain-containing protein [Planctomycetes bacterium]|nr:CBS domain-containing protein [Planctomycetota bacterium]